jgi:hypothetical protein
VLTHEFDAGDVLKVRAFPTRRGRRRPSQSFRIRNVTVDENPDSLRWTIDPDGQSVTFEAGDAAENGQVITGAIEAVEDGAGENTLTAQFQLTIIDAQSDGVELEIEENPTDGVDIEPEPTPTPGPTPEPGPTPDEPAPEPGTGDAGTGDVPPPPGPGGPPPPPPPPAPGPGGAPPPPPPPPPAPAPMRAPGGQGPQQVAAPGFQGQNPPPPQGNAPGRAAGGRGTTRNR